MWPERPVDEPRVSLDLTCPTVIVTPGTPGTAPAVWGSAMTLSTTDPVGFGIRSTDSKVSLQCSDGRTLAQLPILSWSPQEIVCTLPAKSAVAACDAPAYYELWVSWTSLSQLHECGPYHIDIIGTIDPGDPTSIDPNDLTELARGFTISVTIPGPGPIQTGVPVRVQLLPPLGVNLPFTGIDGRPLPVPRKRGVIGSIRLQAIEIAAAARGGDPPPLVVRSEATYEALAKQSATRERTTTASVRVGPAGKGPPAATNLPLPPPPSITVEVVWSVTVFSLFGSTTVGEGTLYMLADPDDPINGVAPTLTSLVLGVLFRPWITASTYPQTRPREVAAYFVNASIRLSVGSVVGEEVPLPAVQLPVPTLEVPALLLLFRDSSFTGRVLPCVPANSLYNKIGPLRTAVGAARDALAPLESVASVASWLLSLDKLLGLLPVDDNTTVAVANSEGKIDLDDYELDHSVLPWNWGDWDWEDQVSSIFLFGPTTGMTINAGAGPTGSSISFFSAPGWSDNEGEYVIDIGFELSVGVLSLSSKFPTSIPSDALTVITHTTDDDFNDVLSTLQFL